MTAPEEARRVREDWIMYDTQRIGAHAKLEKYPGAVIDWAALATLESVSFFNERNVSTSGKAYTNVTSESKIPWPFEIESIGCDFHCPSPSEAAPKALNMVAKIFAGLVADHAWFDFYVREDIRLTLKPKMAPPGYGLTGYGDFGNAIPPMSSYNSGLENSGNRFRWTEKPLSIPADTPIRVELHFQDYARNVLINMGDQGLLTVINQEGSSYLDAQIRFSLRGKRYVQQRGEYFAG